WTTGVTKLLLALYFEKKEDFRNPKIKNKHVWRDIQQAIEGHGVTDLDPDKLDRKFRNLKKTYDNIKVKNRSTGQSASKWEFFSEMEAIFENDLAMNGARTLATNMTEEENEEQLLGYTEYLEGYYEEMESSCATPTTSCGAETLESGEGDKEGGSRKRKARVQKGQYYQKKKALEAESGKVEELKKLTAVMEESNRLQAERNDLLKEFLSKM
ncbi:hypothetical protein KR084_006476, partial [Drosophila pseudotakahashii]